MVTVGSLSAQQEFRATDSKKRPDVIAEPDSSTPKDRVRPPSSQTSVVVMMSEKGLEIFSPLAPSEWGVGEKTLSEPVEHEGKVGDSNTDRKPHGGIRLVGWFF